MTLFPEMCLSFLGESIIGRARENGKVIINCRNIRDYSKDKHKRVDDYPYGGGSGMILQVQPIFDCYKSLCYELGKRPHLICMSPRGKVLNQNRAKELLNYENIAILCGHYEGIDERVNTELVDEEISVGDYVITGGELPALILADCISRMIPGVLSSDESFENESHYSGLLEYPQYTRPSEWHGMKVPDVLLSGNHAQIDKWRADQSLEVTIRNRPDLIKETKIIKKD